MSFTIMYSNGKVISMAAIIAVHTKSLTIKSNNEHPKSLMLDFHNEVNLLNWF